MATANSNQNIDHVKDSAASSADNLRQGVREIGRSVTEVAQQTATDARKIGSELADKVSERASDMTERAVATVSDAAEKGRQQAVQIEKKMEDQIRQQPLTAILASAGIGVLIGMLIKRS